MKAIFPVPKGCTKKNATRKAYLIFSMEGQERESGEETLTNAIPVTVLLAIEGFATAIPAAALVNDTAGVSIPSAIVNPVAKRH